MIRVREIKHHTGVRLGTSSVGKLVRKVNGAVEAQAAIVINVYVQRLEISRGVDDADLASLDKVVGDLT